MDCYELFTLHIYVLLTEEKLFTFNNHHLFMGQKSLRINYRPVDGKAIVPRYFTIVNPKYMAQFCGSYLKLDRALHSRMC